MEVRTRMGRLGLPGMRFARALGALVSIGIWLALAPVASASTPFTWAGGSAGRTESAADWSAGANWEGDIAPATLQAIGTLTFPHLTNNECTVEPPTDTCYLSLNDLSGLSVESMQLDDSDGYFLAGEGVTLGSGGLTAAPAGGGSRGAFMVMPLRLGAPQKWSISDRSGGVPGENGLLLAEELTGAGNPLTVELNNGAALVLENSTEVGPVTIEGSNPARENLDNGSVFLEGSELNVSDGQSVELSHVFFAGPGTVGALTTKDATISVGGGETEPAGALEASSVKLDPETGLVFEVTKSGTVAQSDYAQLVAKGPVELAGPMIVLVRKSAKTGACPTLAEGQTFTFVSTTGPLSGEFSDAPDGGPEIKIDFEKGCEQLSQTMRISYVRTGGTETVTGTVDAQAKEDQEKEATEKTARENEVKQKEAAATKAAEEQAKKLEEAVAVANAAAKRSAEEAAATKKRQEEEAAANRKHEEEVTARGGVLGSKEASKKTPPTRAQLLAKELKQCKKQPKKKRAKCEAIAKKKYGSRAKSKKKK